MGDAEEIVRVHYVGTLEDGTVFDSSRDTDPLEFKLGSGTVIKGFEEAVSDMKIGERRTVTIPCKDAYGYYDDGKIEAIPMISVPNASRFKVGEQTHIYVDKDLPLACKLLRIEDGVGYFDFNLPLAGKDLTFEIERLPLE